MATLLIAEDDDNLRLLLERQLGKDYAVLAARDGAEAQDFLDANPVDLLITDIMMPGIDGLLLVKTLREEGLTIPVLMLTADQSFDTKRSGFSSGTDDFLTKPFNKEELLWRVKALLRRARIQDRQEISIGDAVLDLTSCELRKDGEVHILPKKESDLLAKLLSEPGRIFTKNQLFSTVWGDGSESGEETVKTHISRLRGRLRDMDEISIVAVRGVGYKAEVRAR